MILITGLSDPTWLVTGRRRVPGVFLDAELGNKHKKQQQIDTVRTGITGDIVDEPTENTDSGVTQEIEHDAMTAVTLVSVIHVQNMPKNGKHFLQINKSVQFLYIWTRDLAYSCYRIGWS